MLAYVDYNKQRKRRGNFRNTTKEERAEVLGNVICPRCGYQNKIFMLENMVHVIYVGQQLILIISKKKLLKELRRN